jgi:hypothetical protein
MGNEIVTSKIINTEEGPWVEPKPVPHTNGIVRAPECERECQYAKDVDCTAYACAPTCEYLLRREPLERDLVLDLGITGSNANPWSSAEVAAKHYGPKTFPDVFDISFEPDGSVATKSAFDRLYDSIKESMAIPKSMLFEPTPEFGSSTHSVINGYLKGLSERRVIGKTWDTKFAGRWRCVDITVDKRTRTLIKNENRIDEVGVRVTQIHNFWWHGRYRRITKKMPARMFKRAIASARQEIGHVVDDWDLTVQPVEPVRYFALSLFIDRDGHVDYRAASELQPPDDRTAGPSA